MHFQNNVLLTCIDGVTVLLFMEACHHLKQATNPKCVFPILFSVVASSALIAFLLSSLRWGTAAYQGMIAGLFRTISRPKVSFQISSFWPSRQYSSVCKNFSTMTDVLAIENSRGGTSISIAQHWLYPKVLLQCKRITDNRITQNSYKGQHARSLTKTGPVANVASSEAQPSPRRRRKRNCSLQGGTVSDMMMLEAARCFESSRRQNPFLGVIVTDE